jgi:hypothetical protein
VGGTVVLSDAARLKISASKIGKPRTEETKRKAREAQKAFNESPAGKEFWARLRARHLGSTHSEETKQKRSLALKGTKMGSTNPSATPCTLKNVHTGEIHAFGTVVEAATFLGLKVYFLRNYLNKPESTRPPFQGIWAISQVSSRRGSKKKPEN